MIKIWKKVGQTPLQLLEQVRRENPELAQETLSYAGRLDPMAEGEMIILVGKQENADRKKYLGFDKQYEADVLFGFKTDTYDLLGVVTDFCGQEVLVDSFFVKHKTKLNSVLRGFLKKKTQKYPEYSSKTVGGTPLFEWTRAGKISEIKIPSRKISVRKFEVISVDFISALELWEYIEENVTAVAGDFRQDQIMEKWAEMLAQKHNFFFPVLRVAFHVSSGTYIRGLANEIGEKLYVPACLMKLRRSKIYLDNV